VNEAVCRIPILSVLMIAALLLIAVAWLRSAEYDEQYTLFLTGGVARPIWGSDAITAREVQALQHGRAGSSAIARDLRATDVHPPLYFWTIAEWRRLMGNSLFVARLASVLFSLVTLGLIAIIARSVGIPPVAAILLTVGCYGFAYTGATARAFAMAQMLSVAGVAVLITARSRSWLSFAAGVLLGAATFTNYLAAFVACAALLYAVIARSEATRKVLHLDGDCRVTALLTRNHEQTVPRAIRKGRRGWPAFAGHDECRFHPARLRHQAGVELAMTMGFALWLPADLWFFLVQRQTRVGQFAPFEAMPTLARLAQYSAANLFGGLPLYLHGVVRTAITVALAVLSVGLVALIILRWHRIVTPETRWLLVMTAAAPPIGLLLLGVVFDNSPIELRYLAFATPFVGLLLAAALPRYARYAVLAIQAIALVGLITRPETMQPARATAVAAASLVHDGVVLLPHGNDGVGIVGAFAVESPPTLRLLVIGREETPAEIRARASRYPRAVLALLGQDAASRATLPIMRQAFAGPCWRAAGAAFNVLAFDRACGEGCACPAGPSP
jgi:Dolichyl-phosphate-mannose-protein mannosyltransferase